MVVLCPRSEQHVTRPWPIRALAVAFVVLYLLTAVRGLVPGLCMNLQPFAAAKTGDAAACTIESGGSCCSKTIKQDESNDTPDPRAPKRCPFCRLAHALTESPDYVYFTPLAEAPERPIFAAPAVGVSKPVDRRRAGRGPPQPVHS